MATVCHTRDRKFRRPAGCPGRRRCAVSSGPPETRTASRAALVWGAGMLGYIFAVMQRTTFGVAGLDAADRFSISPATLAAFVFLQTAVYIVAQLPSGLLVDR